jgi:hypothetical protein
MNEPNREVTPAQREAVSKRLSLARRILDVYAENSDLVAAGYSGSVARGLAEDDSDLDLYLFWSQPQAHALENAPLEAIGARRFTYTGIDEEGEGLEQLFFDGIKVDLVHSLPGTQEERTRAALAEGDVSPDAFKNLAQIADLVPLQGDETILRLRDQSRAYPTALCEKALDTFLRFPPPALLAQCRSRQDPLGFADVLVRIATLNRYYLHPEAELKGALSMLDRCVVKPPRLEETLRSLLRNQDSDGLTALGEDLLEMIELIEARHPTVETDRARWLLDFQLDGSGS